MYRYEEQARLDKARYEQEMASYTPLAGAERHFLCCVAPADGSEHCFARHVRTESATEALDWLSARRGCVFCPGCPAGAVGGERSTAFSDASVAQHVDSAVFEVYTAGKRKLLEQELSTQLEAEAKLRFEARPLSRGA